MVLSPEEDRGSKDAMEALHNSAVMAAVLGEPEEVQHVSGTLEVHVPAFLLDGERRYPDGNEAILAEGQAEFRMAGDIEKESPVAPRVNQLRSGRSAERDAAENERAGVVGKLLCAVLPFLADEGDGFKLA